MAYYAALVSVVQSLKDITHHHRYPNFLLDKHQLHFSLYAKFNLLLELLDDYSPKVNEEESNGILERRIRDAAYRAQDIIESRIATILLTHIDLEKRTSGVERLWSFWASTFRHIPDSIWKNKYDQDLEKVKTEVDSIVEELMRIKVESNTAHEDLQQNSSISVEASREQLPSSKNMMLVLDEDLMTKIKAQLCGESYKLEVISIAGMGGLGKTTLARNIFDDRLIHDRFDCRAWVIVSQNYRLKNILVAIVKSLGVNERELDGVGEEMLQQYIYQNLFGRRYLIVMDDVWDTKFWYDIRRIFPNNSNGSRIMMTTRLSVVANCSSSSKFLHQMQFLDEDRSWTLLREKVFGAQEQCPEELETIGKLIAKNCGGLPLAIVVIAGVLSNVKMTRHDWENIARKVRLTAIDQNDQHLSTIFSLSYNHLPHHLKPCFLYLGGYPEDHEIRISKLIKLWVAEGFLKSIDSKSLEEVGEEYLKDLVDRNLVLITKKSNGKFKFCIIHDVLRDLCFQKALDENFLLCVQQKDEFQRAPMVDVRRIYIQSLEYSLIPTYIKKRGSNVRSLIDCNPRRHVEFVTLSVASHCKLLRILDTNGLLRQSNCHEIFGLLHLRFLDLVFDNIDPFPSRTFHLLNLQTLIIISAKPVTLEIWKMPQLRHIMVTFEVELPPIPKDEVRIIDEVPLLGSLQTLSRVINFRFTSDTIFMVPNLQKLRLICHCEAEEKWEEYGLRNLVHLHRLETLYIEFVYSSWDAYKKSIEPYRVVNELVYQLDAIPLPENFAFPSTLIKLTLVDCKLPWKDMSVVGSLPKLQVLKLRSHAFFGEEWEPIEGEFLKLKFLLMQKLPDLKHWRAENTHFPCLERLNITLCDALEEIPSGIGDIPTLQLIQLDNCSSALESSALEIQEQQRDLGNDDLQVHLIHPWQHLDDRLISQYINLATQSYDETRIIQEEQRDN